MGDYKFSSYITVTQGILSVSLYVTRIYVFYYSIIKFLTYIIYSFVGKVTNLGQIIFEVPRNGPPLWEIGFPDRTANEFFIPDPLPGLQNYLYTNTTIHK